MVPVAASVRVKHRSGPRLGALLGSTSTRLLLVKSAPKSKMPPPPAEGGTNKVVAQVRPAAASVLIELPPRLLLEEGLEGAASNCLHPPGASYVA